MTAEQTSISPPESAIFDTASNSILPAAEPLETNEQTDLRRKLDEAEHRQRMEYARIEHERRMELIEAEATLIDEKASQLASEITPSNARLDAFVGQFRAPAGAFDDEEMPY